MPRTPRFLASLALVGVMSGCGATATAHQHAKAGRGETTTVVPAVADPGPLSHLVADRLAAPVPAGNALYTPPAPAPTTPSPTTTSAPTPAPADATPPATAAAPAPAAPPGETVAPTEEAAPAPAAADEQAAAEPDAAPVATPAAAATPTPAPAPRAAATTGPADSLGAASTASTASTASSAGFDAGAEAGFLQATNATRASLGVAPLTMDAGLQAYARRQARAMADAGQVFHSQIANVLGPWSTAGENVGVGPSVGSIHAALVASPGHFRNLSDPLFSAVGVGVVVDGAGRMWTAHVFAA